MKIADIITFDPRPISPLWRAKPTFVSIAQKTKPNQLKANSVSMKQPVNVVSANASGRFVIAF